MKKILYLLSITFLMLQSCTSGDDNTSSDSVPLSPKELIRNLADTSQVTLNWTDNSTNEDGFKIERKSGNDSYTLIGTVESDITVYKDNDLVPSTTYLYRVLAYNKAGNSATYSNEVAITTPKPITIPTIQTYNVSAITATTASSGGIITSDGGSAITARGIVWSTLPNPTIELATKTSNGTEIGGFKSNLNGLTPKTAYYVRAYATNSIGTSYSNETSFVTAEQPYSFAQGANFYDIDDNMYPTIITSCSQTWMQKNLNVSRYRNGDKIPQVTDPKEWANLTTGAWCYYNNDSSTEAIYGKLYNWYAVNDPRGLAPNGWHIPTDNEWNVLTNCLGGKAIAGGKMKETGTSHWVSPNTDANNNSGFSGLASGYRGIYGPSLDYGYRVFWWSSTKNDSVGSWSCALDNNSSTAYRQYYNNTNGFSVRCVKN